MKRLIPVFLILIGVYSNAQPFRYIVASDGSGTHTTVQAAIDACPNAERSIIFIKNGTYYGQTYLGTKTAASTKLISLIGESRDGVVLTYDKSLPMVTKFEEATTFQIYAKDFYAENITFANTAGVSAGQALALYTAGDRATFKNCYLRGFQDTYRAKKGTRGYFKDCKIEGTVDFIYAGGTVFFDDCELYCLQGGGYIVAPEDAYQSIPATSTVCGKALKLEFIFRNCNITAESGVADNSYYLGRPWNAGSGAFYLNCKLGKHINAKGWKEWSGNETTASFAEYNSQNPDGSPADISGRVSWSFQLPESDVTNLFTTSGIYSRISTELYQPENICVSPQSVVGVIKEGNNFVWNKVNDVAGYLILKNGVYFATTTDTSFVDLTASAGAITVKSVGNIGQLSEASGFTSKVDNVSDQDLVLHFMNNVLVSNKLVKLRVFDLLGDCIYTKESFSNSFNLSSTKAKLFIVYAQTLSGSTVVQKIICY